MRARRWVGLCAAVALTLAGCGHGSGPLAVIQTAYADTVAAKTARMSFSVTASGVAGMNMTQSGDGLVDFPGHKAQLNFGHAPQPGAAAQNLQITMIGKDVWVTVPAALASRVPGAKPIVHVDVDGDDGSGDPIGRLVRPDDPAQSVAELRAISSSGLHNAGTERVRGVDTTHYKADIDLNKVAAQDPKVKPHTDQFAQMLGTALIPAEVWVDGDHHVRRIRITFNNLHVPQRPQQQQASQTQVAKTPPQQPGGITLNIAETEEFYDFGVSAPIVPPPADQVMEADQLRKLTQAQSAHG